MMTTPQAPDQATAPRPGCPWELSLLGGFALRREGSEVGVTQRAQQLLALLALSPGPQERLYVAGLLWSETNDERAGAALRTTLWRMRALGPGLVRCEGNHLALHESVRVDLAELSVRAHHALADDDVDAADLGPLQEAGELLPGWYGDWLLLEREHLRQLRLHALEKLSARLSATGRHASAVEAGLAAIICEPLRESAHRVVAAAHLAEGNAAEALRQYHACEALLDAHLGLRPSESFDELVASVRPRG